ncbi:MAG: histidinol-phosphate transaminase [Pseudomonadota bacterium]
MSNTLNRRGFLGGSMMAAGTLAASPVLAKHHAGGGVSYGPEAGMAKLNANENPYGPSPGALNAMMEASSKGAYYVGESVPRLKAMIAERHGLTPDHIALSAGSSGVLTYLAVGVTHEGKKILGPDLFWDTTAKKAEQQGGEIVRVPNGKNLEIDLAALENAITDEIGLVSICNPNNPTGLVLNPDELVAFCKRASKKTTVLIDEAYNELTDDPTKNTMISLVKDGHDVVVARTFSKIYGLAGMRVGYMIASPERLEMVNRYGLGDYAMNQAGVAAAVASYNDEAFLTYSKSKIVEAREMVLAATKEAGLKPLPSATNFVFVNLNDINAQKFREKMQERNVYIRGIYRDYTNWSRVSMGHLHDVERYVAALPAVVDELSV